MSAVTLMDARPRRRVGADYAPSGGGVGLTRGQKAALSILARRAWEERGRPGESADAWRRDVALRAVGRRISQASQADYATLRAAYEDAARQYARAFRSLMRGENNPLRIARHKLEVTCRERGLPMAYPEAICQRQYRCGLAQANASQLWRLVFTVRNRREKKGHTS